MRNSVAPAAPSTPLNTLAPKPAKASMAVNRPEPSASTEAVVDCVSLVFQTFAAIGMSDKEAAYTMALDPAQLSRIKTGQARMPFDAMWRLPDRFWAAFMPKIEESKRLSDRHLVKVQKARMVELLSLLLDGVA